MNISSTKWPSEKHLYTEIREMLPAVFTRKQAASCLNGLLSAHSLSNLDSLGQGPAKQRIGRRVMYERETFVDWLENHFARMKSSNFFSKTA